MTHTPDLDALLRVSRVAYDQQRQAFDRIMKQEAQLRSELARLHAMEIAARKRLDQPMRVIGADLQWQGWLARSRNDLNMALARVLAMKAQEQQRVRKAFGKVTALEELARQAHRTRQKDQGSRQLSQAIAMALHRGPQ